MSDNSLRSSIVKHLACFEQVTAEDADLTKAAVVIGITAHSQTNEPSILLTQRSSKLRKHAGQYALPGGKVDAGESVVDAALRELDEELKLTQHRDDVLGLLDDMPTRSGFNITPVVVWIDNHHQLIANPDEVAAVYEIPLTELESIDLGLGPEDSDEDGDTSGNENTVMSLYLPSVGTTVYSPTAAIIYQFREVALLGRSTRVAHFGQPKFAWR